MWLGHTNRFFILFWIYHQYSVTYWFNGPYLSDQITSKCAHKHTHTCMLIHVYTIQILHVPHIHAYAHTHKCIVKIIPIFLVNIEVTRTDWADCTMCPLMPYYDLLALIDQVKIVCEWPYIEFRKIRFSFLFFILHTNIQCAKPCHV
jgi:hypothetical protein